LIGRATHLLVTALTGATLVLLGGSAPSPADGDGSSRLGIQRVGPAHWFRVGRGRDLDVAVHGIRIEGARGAFSARWGYLVVQAVRVPAEAPRVMRPAGLGIDVRLVHTRLRRPLTLVYSVGRQPHGFVPVVVHRTADGRWRVQRAHRTRTGALILRTKQFSINLPSWLVQWGRDLKQWARDLGQWIASGVGGRTPPLTCGNGAPNWFSYEKRSDLVHTCTINNAGRAEIQLKSNRGITEDVQIPGSPAYVWVEDQPAALRRMLRNVGFDSDHRVLLGAGQRMTVGYTQSSTPFDGSFVIADDTAAAFVDDLLREALDKLVGAVLDRRHQGLLLIYTEAQCGARLHLSLSDSLLDPAKNAGQMLGCMVKELPGQLDNPATLQAIGLEGLDADGLTKATRLVHALSSVIDHYPLLQATALHDVDDELRALLKDGNDRVDVHIAAAPGSSTTPRTPLPGPTPTPTPAPTPTPQTWAEQETPNHPVNTFTNYHNASGMGTPIAAGQWVQVSCKVYDPYIASVNPDGYWYRIASAPWNNAYYSPANTFMNGDPYGGPYTHNTDFAVPNC
jgi:hypothetical protein